MCIAVPGRVLAIDGLDALVETPIGPRRASSLPMPDVAVGDLVAVAAGSIVERLTAVEAAELLALLHRAANPQFSEETHHAPAS